MQNAMEKISKGQNAFNNEVQTCPQEDKIG